MSNVDLIMQNRTQLFQSFTNGVESDSVLLAQAVGKGGEQMLIDLIKPVISVVDLAQIKKLVDSGELVRLVNTKIKGQAEKIELLKEAEAITRLPTETTPFMLLVFVVTKFEAYLEDLIFTILLAHPELSSKDSPQLRVNKTSLEETMRKEANNEFKKRWDALLNDFFISKIGLPVNQILHSAKTSGLELDRAKSVRNLHIHKKGIVDKAFLTRVQNSNEKEGDYLPIAIEYVQDIKDKMYMTALGLDVLVVTKYPDVLAVQLP